MSTTNIQMDSVLIAKAQSVFSDLGLDMTTAMTGFLHQVIEKHSIPSEIPALESEKKAPKLGGLEGKVWMSDDFNEPMEEFKEYW